MTLEVRELAPSDDSARVGQLVRDAYSSLPGYPGGDDDYLDHLADIGARAADATVVVAMLDDTIVGCLTYIDGPRSAHHEFSDPDSASFRYFGVELSVRGSGVAEAMVQWCIDRARTDGRPRIRIHTMGFMPAAQRLYQRLGFIRDEATDEIWGELIGLGYVFHC